MSDAIVEVGTRTGKRFERWLFSPIPLGRVAALRVVIYLFAWYDVFYYSPPVPQRAEVAGAYRPLAVERVLHLPTPTHTLALIVQIAVPCFATLAATGRAPRTLGAITFLLYMDWIVMGDSFGYVAHDRFAFFIALAVLPTVGPARCGDMTPSERAGWAIRCIQLAVVGTYFLSSWAKVRDAGFRWANGAVLTWAFLRRGTPLAHHLLQHPQFLHLSQWGAICAEFVSPVVLFLRGRWVYIGVAAMLGFHLFNEETLRINFFPHVLCILAFLPLEKVGALVLRARQWRPGTRAATAAAT